MRALGLFPLVRGDDAALEGGEELVEVAVVADQRPTVLASSGLRFAPYRCCVDLTGLRCLGSGLTKRFCS
jgi:hypothetical protein